eukprot:6444239-Amphidinium_carterae.1
MALAVAQSQVARVRLHTPCLPFTAVSWNILVSKLCPLPGHLLLVRMWYAFSEMSAWQVRGTSAGASAAAEEGCGC